jgi:hypothetical protein
MYEICATARRRRRMGCAAARIARPHPAPPVVPVVVGDPAARADGMLTLPENDWQRALSDTVAPF